MKINLIDTNGMTLKTAGTYVEEDIEVGLNENDKASLIAENIAKDVTVLGITGTHEGGGAKIISGGKSAVPVDGTTVVDKIFSDTSKSIEEVDAILSQLTYIENFPQSGMNGYLLFIDENALHIIIVIQGINMFGDGRDAYTIADFATNVVLYQNYTNDGSVEWGWITENLQGIKAGAPEYQVNTVSVSEFQGMPVGTQNELLKDIIYVGSAGVEKILKGEYNGDSVSITEPTNVDISALIDEQKIPLAVNVDIPTYDGEQEGGEPFVNPLQKLIDSRYSNTSNGKQYTMRYLFCKYHGDLNWISDLDFSLIVDASSAFQYIYTTDKFPSIDLPNVQNAGNMFYGAMVDDLSNLKLPNLRSCESIFSNSQVKKLPILNLSQCTAMTSFCYYNVSLEGSYEFDIPMCTSLHNAFTGCSRVNELRFKNSDKLTNVYGLCSGCSELETLEISNLINVISFSNINGMIGKCTNIKNLILNNIKTTIQIGSGDGTGTSDYGTLLTLDSLINTIKELIDIGTSRTLTMGTANLAKIGNIYVKLTGEAEEDEANPKLPCEVCNADDEGAMTIIAYANSKNWTIA